MNQETSFVLLLAMLLSFFGWMSYLLKSSDTEQLRLKVEAGLIQKIEGGTVIWTKP